MAEGGGLLNRYTVKSRIGGSNPPLSAILMKPNRIRVDCLEQTDDPELLEAQGRIADLVAKDVHAFMARPEKERCCFLLHLSEGVTDSARPLSAARKHILALEVAPGQWALNKVFTGIHAAGLLPEDFAVLASHGASMVCSSRMPNEALELCVPRWTTPRRCRRN